VDGIADSGSANLNISEWANKDIITERAEDVVRYYENVTHGRKNGTLLGWDSLVFTSSHRTALYVAEVLHAPALPLKFLAYATTWDEIKAAAETSTPIVGWDYGFQGLWPWLDITARRHLPLVYLQKMYTAKQVVVVRSLDLPEFSGDDSIVAGVFEGSYVLRGVLKQPHLSKLADEVREHIVPMTQDEQDHTRQGEWGLPDETIAMMRSVWVQELGRDPNDFVVLEDDTLKLYARIPPIWEAYLAKNKAPVRGFTFNHFWIAHPALERAAGLLPFHYYGFNTPKAIAPWLDKYRANITATNTTVIAFADTIGGGDDIDALNTFLAQNYSWGDGERWFSVGYDVSPTLAYNYTSWRNATPGVGQVPVPADYAAQLLAQPAAVPYKQQTWTPLTVAELVAAWKVMP